MPMHKHMDRTHVAWHDAHTYIHMQTRYNIHTHTYKTRAYIFTCSPSVPSHLSSFPLSRVSPSVWTIGSASSLCLLVLLLPPSSPLAPFPPPQLDGEHSLANLPYTFVCLNWVAFYTRAWSVNRILNYYSDCVLPGAPISPRSLLVHLRPLFIPGSNISYYSLRIFAGRRVESFSSSLLNFCIQLVRKPRTHTGNRGPISCEFSSSWKDGSNDQFPICLSCSFVNKVAQIV